MTYIKLIFCALLANISLYGMEEEIVRDDANLKFHLLLQKFGYKPGEWMKNDEPFWYPVVRDTSIPLDRAFFEIYRERGGDVNASAHALTEGKPSSCLLDSTIAYRCEQGLIKFLVENGLDATITNNRKFTAMHALGYYPRYEDCLKVGWQEDLVGLLMHHGADINARDVYGWTPLDHALQTSGANVAKLLLKHGAECTKDICEVNLKYALMSKKSDEIQLFIAGFYRDSQRKRFLMTGLWGLKYMHYSNKEIRKKIVSFLPNYLPDHCLSRVYPESRVKAILDDRHQEKMRLINELKPYAGAVTKGVALMKELKDDADALASNTNVSAKPASDSSHTKKCSIQ
jgi:hypothetical protein